MHAKVNWGKHKASHTTQGTTGNKYLSQGKSHKLVVQCQLICLENMHKSNIAQTDQDKLMHVGIQEYIYLHKSIHLCNKN